MKDVVPAALSGLAILAGVARGGELARTIAVEPGGTLDVRLARGAVTVRSHDAAAVRVEAEASGWPWSTEFDLETDGDVVRLSDRTSAAEDALARVVRAALWPFHLHAQATVRAWVPERYAVRVSMRGGAIDVAQVDGPVTLATRGGAVSVHGVAGDVLAETAGGPVHVTDIRGSVRVESRGGAIEVARVGGPVHAETRGGAIEVEAAEASVVARTRGGTVEVSFARAPAGELETRGGGIAVRIPSGAGVDLDAETRGGEVRIARGIAVEGATEARRVVGRVNGGGPRLRLRTGGGSINVGTL
jgi:hypothetical protein